MCQNVNLERKQKCIQGQGELCDDQQTAGGASELHSLSLSI